MGTRMTMLVTILKLTKNTIPNQSFCIIRNFRQLAMRKLNFQNHSYPLHLFIYSAIETKYLGGKEAKKGDF